MADKTPDQEPSIEEILASIRQIISDDDEKDSGSAPQAPAQSTAASTPAPKPEPVYEPQPEPVYEPEPEEEEDDVLELTQAEALVEPVAAPLPEPEPIYEPEAEEPEEDFLEIDLQDVEEEELLEEEIPAMPTAPTSQAEDDDSILSNSTRQAAAFSMAKLVGNMPINRPEHSAGSVTLEDLVREILNPMLREWMDRNLPPMVERIVQKELEKLARQVLDE